MQPTVRLATAWMLEEVRLGMHLSGKDQAQVCGPDLDLGLKPVSVWMGVGEGVCSHNWVCVNVQV